MTKRHRQHPPGDLYILDHLITFAVCVILAAGILYYAIEIASGAEIANAGDPAGIQRKSPPAIPRLANTRERI